MFHFNFGYSYGSQESVLQLIKERLPATISLTVGAVVLWIVFGLANRDPLGPAAPLRHGPHVDGWGAAAGFST